MVGGLLVALACLLTWWAAAGSSGAPTTRYVVAARPIGPGERLEPGDLALHTVELDSGLRSSAFTSADSVAGSVALGPIGSGELIQAGSVTLDAPGTSESELTFPVDSTWAVGGRLRAGDRIDVFATYGNGDRSTTSRVLRGAVIRRIDQPSTDHLRTSVQQTITVALGPEVVVADVVDAAQTADVTIVRTTGPDQPR